MAKTPTKKMKNRALALMAVLFAAVCVIIGFLVYYQIINYDVYQSRAIAQQTMNTTINAKRGSITDCNGRRACRVVRRQNRIYIPQKH